MAKLSLDVIKDEVQLTLQNIKESAISPPDPPIEL